MVSIAAHTGGKRGEKTGMINPTPMYKMRGQYADSCVYYRLSEDIGEVSLLGSMTRRSLRMHSRSVSSGGSIISSFWSPPFQGPAREERSVSLRG